MKKKQVDSIPKMIEQALAHHQARRFTEALDIYNAILRLDPNQPDALNLSGLIAQAAGDKEKALQLIQKAVELKPDAGYYVGNLGLILRSLGRFQEAMEQYEKAIKLDPANPAHPSNLGIIYEEMGRTAEAMTQYERALSIRPDHFEALFNLGNAAHSQGLFDREIEVLRKAVQFHPDRPEPHYTLGQALLLRGDLGAGWPEYDWRWKLGDYDWLKNLHGEFAQPRWFGEPLQGKRILVYAEQGMGDVLHFVRYLPRLVELGGEVIFIVHPRLVRLIGAIPGVKIIALDKSSELFFDFHSPLLSLPRALGINSIQDIKVTVPYLTTEPDRVQRWKERLAAIPGFRIGIAWQGNPNARIDRGRSIPLAEFAPLAAVSGVTLVSLQQWDGLDQLKHLPPGMKVELLGDGIDAEGAFIDTAAIMENLDLIVVSDSAITHLAGALGKEVWVPLKKVPDWRFFLDRKDSPWYPTMSLFRQDRPGEWAPVFRRMAILVQDRVHTKPPVPTVKEITREKSMGTTIPLVPQSWGEIIDKITILEIKSEKLTDPGKLANVRKELKELVAVRESHFPGHPGLARLSDKLKKVNESLWWIEDDIRECERTKDFGPKFIELARAVYVTNDQRANAKREINDLLGSALVEEKSYASYADDPQTLMKSLIAGQMKVPEARPAVTPRPVILPGKYKITLTIDIENPIQAAITRTQISRLAETIPLGGKHVLDVACGQGTALQLFKEAGATAIGLASKANLAICRGKGLDTVEMEMASLEFPPNSFDLVWARQAPAADFFPLLTLDRFFTVLKSGGVLYFEVPTPDTTARHQEDENLPSCLPAQAWLRLFKRSGFILENSYQINFPIQGGNDAAFAFFLRKP